MAKKKSQAKAPNSSLMPTRYETGNISKPISAEIVTQLYEGAGMPYDKSLENLDPEALWDEMINDEQASDLKTLLEDSFEALTLQSQRQYDSLPKPQARPSSSSTEAPPIDGPSSATRTRVAQQDASDLAESEPNDTTMNESADVQDTDSAPNEVQWTPICMRDGKTVHLVQQYEHSLPADEDATNRENDEDEDDADSWDIEWIGALGLWEYKEGEGVLRLNCKWVGYSSSENTWEPFNCLGKETHLPESLEEMKEQCRAVAKDKGLKFYDENKSKNKGKRKAAASKAGTSAKRAKK